ncbi:MAG: hypothetical protein ACE5NC_01715 [Anaerolineae bacterium]
MPLPEDVTALAGVWVGAVLTIMVFSYLLSDSPLFRVAEHLLVGTALGFATVVAVHQVLIARLAAPLLEEPAANAQLAVPLALGVLLLAKIHAPLAWVGNPSMALLFGVGAAVAAGGAFTGTLLRQAQATMLSLSPGEDAMVAVNNLILVVGTLGTLGYFYFSLEGGTRAGEFRKAIARNWRMVGRGFIMITFGALFANALTTRISLLIDRVQFLLGDWLGLLS